MGLNSHVLISFTVHDHRVHSSSRLGVDILFLGHHYVRVDIVLEVMYQWPSKETRMHRFPTIWLVVFLCVWKFLWITTNCFFHSRLPVPNRSSCRIYENMPSERNQIVLQGLRWESRVYVHSSDCSFGSCDPELGELKSSVTNMI